MIKSNITHIFLFIKKTFLFNKFLNYYYYFLRNDSPINFLLLSVGIKVNIASILNICNNSLKHVYYFYFLTNNLLK